MDINRNNYESFFLRWVDCELSALDREQVENFVRQNPDLEKELVMLQHTVLVPNDIVCPDKESLYRGEKRRAVPLIWWTGIAAGVLALLISGWLLLNGNKKVLERNNEPGQHLVKAEAGAAPKRISAAADPVQPETKQEQPGRLAPADAKEQFAAGRRKTPLRIEDKNADGVQKQAANIGKYSGVQQDLLAGTDRRPASIAIDASAPAQKPALVTPAINHQPPSAHQPALARADTNENTDIGEAAILIFNGRDNPVGAMLNKTAKASMPPATDKRDKSRRHLNIGLFQVDLK
ncbi:MAG TPA: hypothetical protein VG890_02005 [Puia sp.]|nr:hypothetical protein [Puia sp.]